MEGMINYFIPDDGDTPDHLNIFPIPSQYKNNLKLSHIKKEFPLPGKFHFRFKQSFEGTYVWLDIGDDDPVPDYNGLIISKISRLSDAQPTTHANEGSSAPSKPQVVAPPPVPDLIETNVATPKATEATPSKVFNDDLVGLMSTPITAQSPRGPIPSPTPAPAQKPGDAFDMFAGNPMSSKPATPRGAIPSPMNAPSGNMNQFNMGAMNPPPGQFNMGMNSQQQAFNLGRPPMMNNPMGQMGGGRPPQPAMNMNANAGFNNLQWQGMGTPNNNRPPSNQPPRPNW
ncbi:hypothetical protein AC1031_006550 [Aphanomyces cochlioides]|nr:hypothetical protein AC1031_006550 [Aphanomyces cochlioides]